MDLKYVLIKTCVIEVNFIMCNMEWEKELKEKIELGNAP